MDKYTVDLDKVLNDFEYSELTDQYSIGGSSQPLNNSSAQRQSDLYKLRNPPIKHTINNVFQSLNEYLNTDIGGKNKPNEFNNVKDTNIVAVQEGSVNVSSNITQGFDNGYEEDAPSHNDNFSEFEAADGESETNVDVIGSTVKLENVTISNEECEEVEKVPVGTEFEGKELEEGVLMEINDDKNQERPEIKDECLEAPESVHEIKEASPEVKEEHPEIQKECLEVKETSLEPEIKQFELETSVRELNAPESVAINVSVQPQVVGFDETFGLDDSELHQYLDELENELESKNVNENPPQTVANAIPAIQVDESDINEDTEPAADDNNTVPRPSTLEITNQPQIDLIGEPGSTPYNNMYISKTLPVTEPAPESDSDTSPSVSPTFSDVSTDTAGSTATTESITDSIDPPKIEKTANTDETLNLENISNNNLNSNDDDGDVNESTAEACANPNEGGIESTDVEESPRDVHSESDVGLNIEELESNPQEDVAMEQNSGPSSWLGKQAPLWIPDSEALNCLHCDTKFTVIKRRHHCRACGLVLCSKCCNMKLRLEYLDAEARVCLRCHDILNRDTNSSSGSEISHSAGNSPNHQLNQPNPNNPMEYCSMVPPLQQISGSSQNPPTVMVPVGVLKRKGSAKSRTNKSVMFCDGIRPGSELTNLDNDFNYNESRSSSNSKKGSSPPPIKVNRNAPSVDPTTKSFIPNAENCLPPTVTVFKSDITYTECANNASVVEMLHNEPLTFALKSNLHVHVKIINMDCCINKSAWCFTTEGMIAVGQDEIVLLLEFIDNEKTVPKDMFYHINGVYNDAKKGTSITEYGISLHATTNFLDSKNHIGFLYIRPTFQCLQNVIVPKEPYLIGILVHRWEMPWAKIFPLRLILRLGAEYRYYPSPIISTRQRESVFVEIGHTIINLLADFRNFSYTLPNIRGLTIHMEEKNTTVTIPTNRYDQVMKSISNSSDHILAFGGNFSVKADSHLVCIQDTHGNNENTYTTHAINIHNRPRKVVTGASFIVFNGALKSSSGLTAKSSIVEDGLMIQIPAEHMIQIRETLRQMKNYTIQCGCINATSDESVNIVWGENDINFNTGVLSSVDNQALGGIPSIRVHNGKDYVCSSGSRMIRWTEVFILQNGDENARGQDVDFSKLAESISKATCQALVKYLDLLSSNNFYKIGIRTTLHVENVSYSAGSNGMKLPPIYMKSLDNELIPVLHRITSNNLGENAIVLELVFRILNV